MSKQVTEVVWLRNHSLVIAGAKDSQKPLLRRPFSRFKSNLWWISPYVRESKTVLDSGFQVLDSSFSTSGTCQWDSGFLELYSVFQTLNFQIPQEKISGLISLIPESGLPYIGRWVSSKPDSPSNFTTCLQHLPSSHLNNSLNPPLPYPSHCLAHTRSSFTRFCDTYLEGSIFISVQNKITRSVIIIIPKVEIKWLYRSICTCYKRKSEKWKQN